MKRRSFLKSIAGLPLLGFLPKAKADEPEDEEIPFLDCGQEDCIHYGGLGCHGKDDPMNQTACLLPLEKGQLCLFGEKSYKEVAAEPKDDPNTFARIKDSMVFDQYAWYLFEDRTVWRFRCIVNSPWGFVTQMPSWVSKLKARFAQAVPYRNVIIGTNSDESLFCSHIYDEEHGTEIVIEECPTRV